MMKKLEADGDVSSRLAVTQEFKAAPFSLVWDYYCSQKNAGVGLESVSYTHLTESSASSLPVSERMEPA